MIGLRRGRKVGWMSDWEEREGRRKVGWMDGRDEYIFVEKGGKI